MKVRFTVLRRAIYMLVTFVAIQIVAHAQAVDTVFFKSKGKIVGQIISVGKDTVQLNKTVLQRKFLKQQEHIYQSLDRFKFKFQDGELEVYNFVDVDTIVTQKNLYELPIYYLNASNDEGTFIRRVFLSEGLKLYTTLSFGYAPEAENMRGLYGQGKNISAGFGILLTRYTGAELNMSLFNGNTGLKNEVGFLVAPLIVVTIENLFSFISPFLKAGVAYGSSSFYDGKPAPIILPLFVSSTYPNASLIREDKSSKTGLYYMIKAGLKLLTFGSAELRFEANFLSTVLSYDVTTEVTKIYAYDTPTSYQDISTPSSVKLNNDKYKSTSRTERASSAIGYNIGLQFSF